MGMPNIAQSMISNIKRHLWALLNRCEVNFSTAWTLLVRSGRSGSADYILLYIYFFNSIGFMNLDILQSIDILMAW
jgi:hypothetical protein